MLRCFLISLLSAFRNALWLDNRVPLDNRHPLGRYGSLKTRHHKKKKYKYHKLISHISSGKHSATRYTWIRIDLYYWMNLIILSCSNYVFSSLLFWSVFLLSEGIIFIAYSTRKHYSLNARKQNIRKTFLLICQIEF